jgi:ribosomal protein S6
LFSENDSRLAARNVQESQMKRLKKLRKEVCRFMLLHKEKKKNNMWVGLLVEVG